MNYRIFLTTFFVLIAILIPAPHAQIMAAIGSVNLTQTTTKTQTPAKTVNTKSTVTPPTKVVNVKSVVTPPTKTSEYFIPMTNFPAFKSSTNGDLGGFINILYKYFIGIAAVLAVLEITWGGFLWMGSGASVTSKEAGKKKINMALMGLLLVLSPVIIFSIINPSVLNLKLGGSIKINKIVQKPNITTTQTPAVGCTLVGSKNPYFEKFLCNKDVSASGAIKYCPSSLPNKTISCNQQILIKGKAECVSKKLYCSGKRIEISVYKIISESYRRNIVASILGYTIFPKDITINNSFSKICTNNGGVLKKEPPSQILLELNTSCKSYPDIQLKNPKDRAVCYKVTLTCEAP